MTETVERLTLAAVNAKIEGHEDVCAERYKGIGVEMNGIRIEIQNMREAHKESSKEIKGALKWAGTIAVTLLLSVAGWGISQQFQASRSDREADRAQREAERSQIQLLQSQMSTFAASVKGNPVAVTVSPAPAADADPGARAPGMN